MAIVTVIMSFVGKVERCDTRYHMVLEVRRVIL